MGWWEWGVGLRSVGRVPRGWDLVEVRGGGGGEEVGEFRVGGGGARGSVRFARWRVLGGGSYFSIVELINSPWSLLTRLLGHFHFCVV